MQLEEGTQVEVRPLSKPDDPEEALEHTFEQRLLEKGLITEIKEPQATLPQGDRSPIKAQSKPLSQMIIEERP